MNEFTFRQIMFLLHKDSSDQAYDAMEYFFYEYLPDDVDPDVTLIDYLDSMMYV
jgi:hypothetical protein